MGERHKRNSTRDRDMKVLTQWKGRKSKLILPCCTLLALHRGRERERERDKQVCCTTLSLHPPLLLSVGGALLLRDSWKQPVASSSLREKQNLSAARSLFLLHRLFSSSAPTLLLGASGSQDDAGGVHHGGIWCSCSRPSGWGGYSGLLGCPLQTSPNSKTGGRSVLQSLCCFFLSLNGDIPN